jgi:cyclomaltodextrin glucanotransferase
VKAKSIARLQPNGIATLPGDRILVIGDCPELGEWDLSKGVPLEYVNHNTWFGELAFNESAGKPIAYKLVVIHPQPDAAPGRENRVVRRRPIMESGVAKWRDVWEE